MNWVCKDCLNIKRISSKLPTTPKSKPDIASVGQDLLEANDSKVKQLEGIIDLLMKDIGDLKQQLQDQKDENNKLSDTIAIKMEEIYKLELTINNLIRDYRCSSKEVNTGPTELLHNKSNSRTTETQTQENRKGDRPRVLPKSVHTQKEVDCLIIGDSIVCNFNERKGRPKYRDACYARRPNQGLQPLHKPN